uniref:Uncharacterized protein n=1 Tax=Bacteriophage sp. TaxID=38018 RepID=A0A8D9PE59_9VIRU|nr:MAG TPA: hypothetical protein [Bacteriophage sp.]
MDLLKQASKFIKNLRMERVLSGRFFCIRGTLFP